MSDASLIQRSSEWFDGRRGSMGASVVRKATGVLQTGSRKGQPVEDAVALAYELAAERLTGVTKSGSARDWGVATEAAARDYFTTFMTNDPVTQVGLIRHPEIAGTHASPDALVGDDAVLEIKCPTSGTHLRWLHRGAVPEEHMAQIEWLLACTGRKYCDFLSFDPRFPEPLNIFHRRVERDDAAIKALEERVRDFITTVGDIVAWARK